MGTKLADATGGMIGQVISIPLRPAQMVCGVIAASAAWTVGGQLVKNVASINPYAKPLAKVTAKALMEDPERFLPRNNIPRSELLDINLPIVNKTAHEAVGTLSNAATLKDAIETTLPVQFSTERFVNGAKGLQVEMIAQGIDANGDAKLEVRLVENKDPELREMKKPGADGKFPVIQMHVAGVMQRDETTGKLYFKVLQPE